VQALEGPSVLLLDAPWGSGKSTFVKMWRGELTKAGIPSVYFDAFANDYQEDAFIAVASQIIAEAESVAPKQAKILAAFKTKALQTAKVLGRASVGLAVRAATAGLVEAEGLGKAAAEIAKTFGDQAANAADEVLKARLQSHNADQAVFENFRRALVELAGALSVHPKIENGGASTDEKHSLPLVFIIDELDRCRPSFALEILEKTKHFFSVPGVTFMLVCSRSQLEMTIRFAYGDIDARSYLEKFYHFRILFPTGTFDRPDMAAATYLRYVGCGQNVAQIVEEFSRIHPLSLRTLERIVAYAKIAEASVAKKAPLLPQILSVLCIVKVIRPELYEAIRESGANFGEILELMRFGLWRDPYVPGERSPLSVRVENWCRFAFGQLKDDVISSQFSNALFQYGFSLSQLIPYHCGLIDGFSFPDSV
jgi:hypothetical protein